MKINKLETVIAERVLFDGDEKVLVKLGAPELFEDHSDYYCPYSIEYKGKIKINYAGGMDSIQSLQLALKKIDIDLCVIEKNEAMTMSWLLDAPGNKGF